MTVEQTISAIDAAAETLRKDVSTGASWIDHAARENLLHPQSLGIWLEGWLNSLTPSSMQRLVDSTSRKFGGRVTTLAPGNVPVVAAECVVVGLLAGVHHRVALSTRASGVATRLLNVLSNLAPKLAERVELRLWRELGESERQNWLTEPRIVVYGSADTVEWVAARSSASSVLVPHGPNIAVGVALGDADRAWIRGFSDDLSTYDQRGCRSPHVLLLAGCQQIPDRVVRELGDALSAIAEGTPLGPRSEAETASRFLDSITSKALGTVTERDGWCITTEAHPRALRASPLGRTIRVVAVGEVDQIPALLETLPAPVGLIVTPSGALPDGLELAQTVEVDSMGRAQKPAFDRLHDGRHRLDELLMA